jgi:hypothetical protein
MADESTSSTAASSPPRAAAQEMQPINEPAGLAPIYTNFARVTGSPEELILDFGLTTDPTGNPHSPVKISERLVMNYYTAKRLWMALGATLKRQETVFGVLETDVTKRVVPQSLPKPAR